MLHRSAETASFGSEGTPTPYSILQARLLFLSNPRGVPGQLRTWLAEVGATGRAGSQQGSLHHRPSRLAWQTGHLIRRPTKTITAIAATVVANTHVVTVSRDWPAKIVTNNIGSGTGPAVLTTSCPRRR
jgi:hypothetical protein